MKMTSILSSFGKKIYTSAIACIIICPSFAYTQKDTTRLMNDSLKELFTFQDDPDVAYFDSILMQKFLCERNSLVQDFYSFDSGLDENYIPSFSDSVYSVRLAKLNQLTPLKLDYNFRVRGFIELYAVRKRELTSKILGLTDLYFPLFEEALDRHGMPLEIKYLAVIESALNPKATSPVGAKGLWQFMYGTGKMFGLNVNSYVDDRSDPVKSTEAACKYLKFLYRTFGDWNLAMAAYNCGPGNVNKAIRRSGGKKDYWEIYEYLPKETRGYVPAFIAVNYLLNYAKEHNIKPEIPSLTYDEIDTIAVKKPISFNHLATTLGLKIEEVRDLNPTYKLDLVPCIDGKFNTIRLPKQQVGAFLINEESIYALAEKKNEVQETKLVQETITHKVKKGETLAKIANKYHVSVAELKKWNKIKGKYVGTGVRLKIKTSTLAIVKPQESNNEITTEAKIEEVKNTEVEEKPAKKITFYTVKKGDTLYGISQKYSGVSLDDILKANNLSKKSTLKVGDKIKIIKNS